MSPERLEAVRANGDATDLATRLIARLNTDLTPLAPLLPKMGNRAVWHTTATPVFRAGTTLLARHARAEAKPSGRRLCLADAGCGGLAGEPWTAPAIGCLVADGRGRCGCGSARAEYAGTTLSHTNCGWCYLGSPAAMPVASGVFAAPWPASVPVPVPSGQLQLWRPDGVIAFAGEHRQLDALSDWLASWLVPAQAPVGAG